MPLPQITVTRRKDGREVASFRDSQGGRVGTSAGAVNWTRAAQMRELADFGILCQLQQCAAGLGSDGQPMPALKGQYGSWKAKIGLQNKRDLHGPGGKTMQVTRKVKPERAAVLMRASHLAAGVGNRVLATRLKARAQGRGAIASGHLLDELRINYLDDRKATYAITTRAGRIKARANEQRASWWGWSRAVSMRLMRQKAGALFGSGPAERLFELGIIGASALAFAKARYLRAA